MKELKNCPFCGSNAQTLMLPDETFGVICNNRVSCGGSICGFDTVDKVVDAWNKRVV